MKKSMLMILSLVLTLFACKKEEMPVQTETLYGTWSMATIVLTTSSEEDSFLGPDLTKELFAELFAEYTLEFSADGKIILQSLENQEDRGEVGNFKLDAGGRILEYWASDDEEPEFYMVEMVRPGIIAITTLDGVRMEFVRK